MWMKLIALRMAKTLLSFGCSECNTVKHDNTSKLSDIFLNRQQGNGNSLPKLKVK